MFKERLLYLRLGSEQTKTKFSSAQGCQKGTREESFLFSPKRTSLQIIQTLAVSLLFAAILGVSLSAFAKGSNETENLCRAQAKEAAKETYKNCMLETKSAQLEKLQKAYEKRIQDLRSQYESELKQLGAQSNNPSMPQKNSKLQSSNLNKNSELPRNKKGRIEIPASADEAMDIPEPIPLGEE